MTQGARPLLAGALVALAAGPLVGGHDAAARPEPAASPAPSGRLVVIDQPFAVRDGVDAVFTVQMTERLDALATTTSTTTTSSPSTSTTTGTATPTTSAATPTTSAATVEPGIDAPGSTTTATTAPASSPTSTATTSTTVPAIPAPPRFVVQIRPHRALSTREDAERAIAGDPGPLLDIVELSVDDLVVVDGEPGPTLEVRVPISTGRANETTADLSERGVYPITIQLRDTGAVVAETTTFVELVDRVSNAPPIHYAVVASITDPGPLASDADLARAAAQVERMTGLAERLDAPLSVAIPPTVVTEIGGRRPALVDRLVDALGPSDLLAALPDLALDVSAWAQAGRRDRAVAAWAAGEAVLDERFTDTVVRPSFWPVRTAITDPGGALLSDLGVDLLLVPAETYLGFEGNLGGFATASLLHNAVVGEAAGDAVAERIAIVDPQMEVLRSDHPGSPTERAAGLLAVTSIVRHQLEPDVRGFVVTPPTLDIPDPGVVTALATMIDDHPYDDLVDIDRFTALTNSFFVDGVAATVELDDAPTRPIDDRAELESILRAEVDDVATMLPRGDPRPDTWRERLRTTLADTVTDRDAALLADGVADGVATVRDAVRQPEQFPFTVSGEDSPLPVRIENTGATPLRVVVSISADRLATTGDVSTVLAPNAVTEVIVPVTARSNGVFPVTVEVLSPTGTPLTEPATLTARANTLRGLGRVVTVAAGLVLASWWFSYFRKRRRERTDEDRTAARLRHPSAATPSDTPS